MNVTVRRQSRPYRTVTFDRATNTVHLIEQRRLPHAFEIVACRDYRETAAAIRDMVVRGAPAIAATAAYGLAQGAAPFPGAACGHFNGISTACSTPSPPRGPRRWIRSTP